MNRKLAGLLLAGTLALGLAACSSTPMGYSTASTGSASASPYSLDSGASGGSPSAIESTSGAGGQLAAMPNSRVTLIETIPRTASASGTVGSSGSSGTTGSSGADSVYRITVLMDDGATRVITQDWAPAFRSGDRVRVTDGAIQR
jgi:hypothetical protein